MREKSTSRATEQSRFVNARHLALSVELANRSSAIELLAGARVEMGARLIAEIFQRSAVVCVCRFLLVVEHANALFGEQDVPLLRRGCVEDAAKGTHRILLAKQIGLGA